MASKAENCDNDGIYRRKLKKHFMQKFGENYVTEINTHSPHLTQQACKTIQQNSDSESGLYAGQKGFNPAANGSDADKMQKFRESYVTEFPTHSPHLKQQACKTIPQNSDFESGLYAGQKGFNPAANGGDADRMLNRSMYPVDDYYKLHNHSDNCCSKPFAYTSTQNARASLGTRQTSGFQCYCGDHNYIFKNDSTLRRLDNNSEDGSAKSQKSSKTVVSRSSHDLKKLIHSQCKLREEIAETIREGRDMQAPCNAQEDPTNAFPLTLSQCKRCSGRLNSNPSQKDVTTEIGKGDNLNSRNNNTLTISVDDVINSRVIYPMINKLHRMYLNNLKEEMSLMEDLETLPNKVNEVYKFTILKQKD